MVRRARELNADQKVLVSAVKRVARQRARVNANYVNTILQARESGVTYAAIAAAVGTSSQAVQEIVRRHRAAASAEAARIRGDAEVQPADEELSAPSGAGPAGGIAAVSGTDTGMVGLNGDVTTVSGGTTAAL